MEHEQAASEAEAQADRLKQHGDELSDEIDSARQDWQAKKADPSVPGAQADRDESGGQDDESEDASQNEGEDSAGKDPEDASESGSEDPAGAGQ